MSSTRWIATVLATLGLTGCFLSPAGGGDDDVLGGAVTVTGSVVDFQTSAAVPSGASVQTSGLVPPPQVSVNGSTFQIDNIPENSAFQILASAPPTHRATFSSSIAVVADDVSGVKAPVVAESFLAGLATAFGVNPTAARGVLIAQVVDGSGVAKAGVAATTFALQGGPSAAGPFFLDANLMAVRNATATSGSGWVVFFELEPGVVSLGSALGANVTLDMDVSPVTAGTVTIATIQATDGAPPMVMNVSFSNQVLPVFTARGCVACHKGNNVGTDLGGLSLNQGAQKVYTELTDDPPKPPRVVPGKPEMSLLVTMPSRENPPDRHPNITFASPNDPDLLKIYVWIKEGAKQN